MNKYNPITKTLVKDDEGDNKYEGMSYLEVLYEARKMENDAIQIALALDKMAPPKDRGKFIEIANDENDHDRIYAEIIQREEGVKTSKTSDDAKARAYEKEHARRALQTLKQIERYITQRNYKGAMHAIFNLNTWLESAEVERKIDEGER